MRGGRLKDANTVIESLSANSAKLALGTGRVGDTKPEGLGPNILVY